MNSYVKTIEARKGFYEVSSEYLKDEAQEKQAEYKLKKELGLD